MLSPYFNMYNNTAITILSKTQRVKSKVSFASAVNESPETSLIISKKTYSSVLGEPAIVIAMPPEKIEARKRSGKGNRGRRRGGKGLR